MYDKSYRNIKEDILDQIQGIDTREGSFINTMVSPIALKMESIYQQLNKILGITFLEDCTGEYLEKRARTYGVTRKAGTYAKGYANFTGVGGAIIPKGTLISTNTGLIFYTEDELSIDAGGTCRGAIKSEKIGYLYNLDEGVINIIPVGINGVHSVTNEATTNGSDIETDEELLNRVLTQIKNPATSGNKVHYKLWSLEVNGIGDAKVFPLAFGNGTVLVMPITRDKRRPGEEVLSQVRDNIEKKKPIGATVTVEGPEEVVVNVTANITIDPNYSLNEVTKNYQQKFEAYIQSGIFKLANIDYFRCLSIAYEVEGIQQVNDFRINGSKENISIGERQIQVAGSVTIETN